MPPSHMAAFWGKVSLQMIDLIFVMQSPTGKKVADVLQSQGDLRPEEEAVLWWLKDFVSSLDAEYVADFSDSQLGHQICQCPVLYTSRNELKREWRAMLSNSDSFHMSLL